MQKQLASYYNRYAELVEPLPRRQRVLLLVIGLLVLYFSADVLLLAPAWRQERQLEQRITQHEKDNKTVERQIALLAQKGAFDPDAATRSMLTTLRARLVQRAAEIAALQQGLVEPGSMARVLESILGNHKGLTLVALRTLPAVPVTSHEASTPADAAAGGSAAATAKDRDAAAAGSVSLVYKHGVELTVRGTYFDLLEYVAQLERASARMYWGKAQFKVEAYPTAALTLTLYTLSLDKTWLIV